MNPQYVNVFKDLSQEQDPGALQEKFLRYLVDLQNVERGSIWIKKDSKYLCVEALGRHGEQLRGMTLDPEKPSIVGWVMENGKMTIAEAGADMRHRKDLEADFEVKSSLILCFPLTLKSGKVYGALQVIDTSAGGSRLNLDPEYLETLQGLVDFGAIALSNLLEIATQVKKAEKLKKRLANLQSGPTIVGSSKPFVQILELLTSYARTDYPVLINGESGTGKELAARAIFEQSARKDRPFVVQNCSAIPDTLLESELFGYRKGAFTGALRDKRGLFEVADKGTIFLDEIGEMDVRLQARLLRVLQENEIKPLGGEEIKKVDVRIISATNRNLEEEVELGRFREDLYYRLNVLPLRMPSLRERRDDIPILLDHFLTREAEENGSETKTVSREALEIFTSYDWPGNIRELENFVKQLTALSPGKAITPADLPERFLPVQEQDPIPAAFGPQPTPPRDGTGQGWWNDFLFEGLTWSDVERAYALHLLEKYKWNVTKAAKAADVNRSTFDSRLKKLGIHK